MDRLICGDVGYGKTEVAIRAAFKAVQESKQVVLSGADYDSCAAALQYFCTAHEGFPGHDRTDVAVSGRLRSRKRRSKV